MNIFFKIGGVVFKVFAIFLILLALLLEYLSKIRSFPKNEFDYSKDNNMGKSFNRYPPIKHYGY
ncbi:MAG: hypothetical protein E7Z85_04815 [Methanosphaera stadtmanae]|nr:hypothetical protein [Methanosphaera stadtmanae]